MEFLNNAEISARLSVPFPLIIVLQPLDSNAAVPESHSAILCFNLVRPCEVFVEVGGSAFEGFEGVGGDDGAEVGPGEEVEFGVGGGEDLEVGGC